MTIEQLNELGFNSIGDIIDSIGYKNYVIKIFEEEAKHRVSDGTYLLDKMFKSGISKDKITFLSGKSDISKSYMEMIPDYINYLLRLKKLQKIQQKIKK